MKIFHLLFALLLCHSGLAQCYTMVRTTGEMTIGLRDDGSLWSWGRNHYGALGIGSNSFSTVYAPTQIGSGTDWSSIYAMHAQMLAIKNDGSLWAWGLNVNGECGNGTTGNQNFITTPEHIGTSNWISVAAGNSYSIGIQADGTLWAWGLNDRGQFGNGLMDNLTHPVPQQMGTANDWAKVYTSGYTSFAIKTDGTLWAWGDSSTIGYMGTAIENRSPHQIGTASNWASISACLPTAMGVKTDGTLWVWGRDEASNADYYGNGIGNTSDYRYPTQVGSDTDWQSAATDDYEFKAIKTDGTLWAWGKNYLGILGDGTTISRYYPVQLGTDTDWAHVDAGLRSYLSLKADHSLYHWGVITQVPIATYLVPTLKGTACPTMATLEFETNTVAAYPNPTAAVTTIHLGEVASGTLRVTDILGQQLYSEPFFKQSEIAVDLNGYASGLYLISIQNGNKIQTVKISKQ